MSDVLDIGKGGEFTVLRRATPGTGYLWHVEILPPGIELLGCDTRHASADVRPGDTVAQTFRFRAKAVGSYEIMFSLKRGWERRGIESTVVNVNVSE